MLEILLGMILSYDALFVVLYLFLHQEYGIIINLHYKRKSNNNQHSLSIYIIIC